MEKEIQFLIECCLRFPGWRAIVLTHRSPHQLKIAKATLRHHCKEQEIPLTAESERCKFANGSVVYFINADDSSRLLGMSVHAIVPFGKIPLEILKEAHQRTRHPGPSLEELRDRYES